MFAEHPECTTGETAQCGLLLLPRRQHAECRTQNAERRMQNAECRMQNAEHRMQSAERRMLTLNVSASLSISTAVVTLTPPSPSSFLIRNLFWI